MGEKRHFWHRNHLELRQYSRYLFLKVTTHDASANDTKSCIVVGKKVIQFSDFVKMRASTAGQIT